MRHRRVSGGPHKWKWVASLALALGVWVWWLDPVTLSGVVYMTPLVLVVLFLVLISKFEWSWWCTAMALVPVTAISTSTSTYVLVLFGVVEREPPLGPLHPLILLFSGVWLAIAVVAFLFLLSIELAWRRVRAADQ